MKDYAIFEKRKAAAIAQGWEVTNLGAVWHVQSCTYIDALGREDSYAWIGDTPEQVWWELLMDAEIYDELTRYLGVDE